MEVAQSIESVDKQTLAMKNDMSEQNKVVHHVSSSGPYTRCGKSNHFASQCPYKGFECLKCGKQGHLKVVCHSKDTRNQHGNHRPCSGRKWARPGPRSHQTKYVEEAEKTQSQLMNKTQDLALFNRDTPNCRPIKVEVQCGANLLEMEIDTGAAVSIISQSEYQSKLTQFPLHDSDVVLKTYTSEMLEVIGETNVKVWYKEQEAELDLIIVKGRGPALFGRNWLNHLVLNWKEILHMHMSMDSRVEHQVKKCSKVFSNHLGTMSQPLAKLYLKPNTTPKFWCHCSAQFALKDGKRESWRDSNHLGLLSQLHLVSGQPPFLLCQRKTDPFVSVVIIKSQ